MECEASRNMPNRPPAPRTQEQTSHAQDERITNIRNCHDEAYLYIEQGLNCDEQGQTEQAAFLYKKGIDSIEIAIKIYETAENKRGASWEIILQMISKMRGTKTQMQTRIDHLLSTDAAAARGVSDPPPSYEAATSPTAQTDGNLDNILNDNIMTSSQESMANATELFCIEDGVQIFFISPEGYVSAPSYPSALGIYTLDEQQQGASNSPPAFLRVGDWTYPLVPGQSPVLRADWGAYIFPDVTADAAEGSSVGVIIPDKITADQRQCLEDLLNNMTAFRTQEPAVPAPEVRAAQPQVQERRTSETISKGIVTGAEWISWGLKKGAEKTSVLLKKGSGKLREHIQPDEEAKKVDPRYQKAAEYTRTAATGAVKVSSFVVSTLGKATMALGKQLAPHVRKQGEKLLPDSMKPASDGRSKLDGVFEVAVGGLRGFGTVYMGLEHAGSTLAKSIANETVQIVHHKYGQDAGKLTEDTLHATGGIAVTAYNVSSLGVKAIAKRAAKDAGAAVVQDYHKEAGKSNKQNNGTTTEDGSEKSHPDDMPPPPPPPPSSGTKT
jgi:spartin